MENLRKYYFRSVLIPFLAGIVLFTNSRQFAFENVAKVQNFGSCYSSVNFDFIIPDPSRNPNVNIGEDHLTFRLTIHNLMNLKFAENFHTLLFVNSYALFQFNNCIKTTLYQPLHIFKRVIRI